MEGDVKESILDKGKYSWRWREGVRHNAPGTDLGRPWGGPCPGGHVLGCNDSRHQVRGAGARRSGIKTVQFDPSRTFRPGCRMAGAGRKLSVCFQRFRVESRRAQVRRPGLEATIWFSRRRLYEDPQGCQERPCYVAPSRCQSAHIRCDATLSTTKSTNARTFAGGRFRDG